MHYDLVFCASLRKIIHLPTYLLLRNVNTMILINVKLLQLLRRPTDPSIVFAVWRQCEPSSNIVTRAWFTGSTRVHTHMASRSVQPFLQPEEMRCRFLLESVQ